MNKALAIILLVGGVLGMLAAFACFVNGATGLAAILFVTAAIDFGLVWYAVKKRNSD